MTSDPTGFNCDLSPEPFGGGAAARPVPYRRTQAIAPANDNLALDGGGCRRFICLPRERFPLAGAPAAAVAAQMTVLQLDQCRSAGWTLHAVNRCGVGATQLMSRTLRALAGQALNEIRVSPDRIISTEGDSVCLLLATAEDAVAFASRFHQACAAYNQSRLRIGGDEVLFVGRVGIATGEVVFAEGEASGLPFIVASRLEAACRPGETILDSATRAALPVNIRDTYRLPELIRAKHGETFCGFRRCDYQEAATHASPPTERGGRKIPGLRLGPLWALARRL